MAEREQFFDEIAPRWDKIYGEDVQAGIRAWCRRMPLEIPDGGVLLDIGAGTGVSSAALAERFPRASVLSVDLSIPMLEAGRSVRGQRVRWLCADGARLPMEGESADGMLALHCWPHFPNKAAALGEWRRVLKPGAALWIVHLKSRAAINNLHRDAHEAVREDRLPTGDELARHLARGRFQPKAVEDGRSRYFVQAVRLP